MVAKKRLRLRLRIIDDLKFMIFAMPYQDQNQNRKELSITNIQRKPVDYQTKFEHCLNEKFASKTRFYQVISY